MNHATRKKPNIHKNLLVAFWRFVDCCLLCYRFRFCWFGLLVRLRCKYFLSVFFLACYCRGLACFVSFFVWCILLLLCCHVMWDVSSFCVVLVCCFVLCLRVYAKESREHKAWNCVLFLSSFQVVLCVSGCYLVLVDGWCLFGVEGQLVFSVSIPCNYRFCYAWMNQSINQWINRLLSVLWVFSALSLTLVFRVRGCFVFVLLHVCLCLIGLLSFLNTLIFFWCFMVWFVLFFLIYFAWQFVLSSKETCFNTWLSSILCFSCCVVIWLLDFRFNSRKHKQKWAQEDVSFR